MSKLKLVVLGMMGRCPFGGQTWLYINWLLGLRALGHDVYYVEDDNVWPYDPELNSVTDDCSYAIRHISSCMDAIGMSKNWAFRFRDGEGSEAGMTPRELDELYGSCDALLNIVGGTDLRDEQLRARYRIYVETDPVAAEVRLAAGDEHTKIAFGNYDVIATYGENFGAPDCLVPVEGLAFKLTRQPIDLTQWTMAYEESTRYFTTIGNYRQSGDDVEHNGEIYFWSKHHEWERFLDLARLTSQDFELALMVKDPEDQQRLQAHGWRLRSPLPMSLDAFGDYRDYIRASRAEFTVAKDQNVRMRSGWFSERDACYLASGKPVVIQDTGFSNFLPTGEGLFGFLTVDEALAAIDEINRDYKRHCEAARAIAEEYFEAKSVAARLLSDVGLQ
jgi:hypothetical protein